MQVCRVVSILACVGIVSGTAVLLNRSRFVHADTTIPPKEPSADKTCTFTKEQLAYHSTASKGIFVAFGDGVYDITKFIHSHPGGNEKIMQAAGKNIEPYWENYAFHHKQQIYDTLEQYRVGTYLSQDSDTEEPVPDPFATDPIRSSTNFTVHNEKPYASEADLKKLFESGHVTPTELFFVRHHFAVPEHPGTLTIDGEMRKRGDGQSGSVRVWTLDELKGMEMVEECVSLQCAGNRRDEWDSVVIWCDLYSYIQGDSSDDAYPDSFSNTQGLLQEQAYMHLSYCITVERGIGHVLFKGADGYEASIPLYLAEKTIIATEMNGQPLTLDHGYPLRAIVPGVVAARSVKYLTSITLTPHESDSVWHQSDYRICPPSGNKHTLKADMKASHSIYDTGCQSAIMTPGRGEEVGTECEVGGYAYSGGGRGIRRVDLSCDGGMTWRVATLDKAFVDDGRNFDWTLWRGRCLFKESDIVLKKGEVVLMCRAVDGAGNSQPNDQNDIYNVRGVNVNGIDRVNITVA